MPNTLTRAVPLAALALAVLSVPSPAQTDRTAVPEAGDRAALDTYLATLAGTDLASCTREQKLAFWINAYNILAIDLVQFVIYIGGAIVALWLIVQRLPGGWDQIIAIGGEAGKLRVLDLSFEWSNAYGLWAGLIGGLFITLGSHGVDQMMVQRYLCARNLRDAQRAVWVGGFVVVAQFALFLLIMSGFWTSFNQIFYTMPEYIRDYVDTGDLVATFTTGDVETVCRGYLDGDRLGFEYSRETAEGAFGGEYVGRVSGDLMSGEVDMGEGGTTTWRATRDDE